MKKYIFFLLLIPWCTAGAQQATQLTLDECRSLAEQSYPVTAQKPVIQHIMELDVQNMHKTWLPHLNLDAQATYQSDVTALPIKIPQIQIPQLSKDQYKADINLQQTIYDGGTTSRQIGVRKAGEAVDQQQVTVQLYQLKQKVDDIYLNILFINDNIALTELLKKDIQTQINKMAAMVRNGTALSTSLDELQAELLQAGQQETELNSDRKGWISMLAILINRPVSDSTAFIRPAVPEDTAGEEISRPEIGLYTAQKNLLQQEILLTGTQNIPRLNFFAQGGYGKPGLNMLEDKFKFYYITGITFSMPVYDWKVSRRQENSLRAQQSLIDLQKAAFIQSTSLDLSRQQQDISKYKALIASDRQLVALRTRIKDNAASQLTNGVITVNDYLTDLNAENQTLLNQRLHELQLLMAQLTYQTTLGK